MSETTRKLLAALAEDPETLERFKQDPKAVMKAFDVPENHQQLILADDKEALKREAGLDDQALKYIIL